MSECVHEMNPDWCAFCKKLKTAEEEAQEEHDSLDTLIERLNK